MRRVAEGFQAGLRSFARHPLVGEARGIGLAGALQLTSDKAAKIGFLPKTAIGPLVRRIALEEGLGLREAGDAVVLAPPLIITAAEVEELFVRLRRTLDRVDKVRPR
ncbi:MAG: hypothetical protein AB7F09_20765 [Parvibaculaceae bacterium]